MKANKEGQIVKFHTPLEDENPNQLYVVLEVIEDGDRSRAEIQALNTGLSFPPVNKVRLSDLEVVEIQTSELIGHKVTVQKSDSSKSEGRVIKVSKQKIEIYSSKKGVESNVWLTIVDKDGNEHQGTLFIDQM